MLKMLLNKPTMSSMLGGKQAHLATHTGIVSPRYCSFG